MKVLLANPRGFCAGVNMAVETLERALDVYGPPLFVFHEIVHNRIIVERFSRRGVIFVDGIEEVPEGATLLFSAHGVAPEIRSLSEKRKLNIIDATCPLVTKVHLEAKRFAKEGYEIFLIGHENHDEVTGTLGEAPHVIILIEDLEDVARLSDRPKEAKLAYLTQTTLSVDDANSIVRALRARFPQIVGPPREDICYATQNRQDAVKKMGSSVDVVIVLGSQNSSNSLRLVEIAKGHGKRAHLIDEVREIEDAWFSETDKVLITAGASAPEDVVQACIEYFRRRHNAEIENQEGEDEKVYFAIPIALRSISKQIPQAL